MVNTHENKQEIIKLIIKGVKYSVIANKYKISRQTLNQWSKEQGLQPRKQTEPRTCKHCGKSFIAQFKSTKAYCKGCYRVFLRESKQSDSYNAMRLKGLSVRQWQRKAREVANNYMKLDPSWRVHHLNGDITNNDPSNLFVFYSHSLHLAFHHRLKKDQRCKPKSTDGFYCN
jgi:transposase-like protein